VPPKGGPPKSALAEEDVRLAVSPEEQDAIARRWLVPAQGATPATPKGRAPNRLEAEVVSLAQTEHAFRVGERDLTQALSDVRWLAIEEIMGRVRAGKFSRRNLKSQMLSGFRAGKKAEAKVEAVLADIGERGQLHVKEELARMERAGHKD
jgi:hypothetical protein